MVGVRYHVGAVEQVGARVLDAGVLGTGQRVAADEPRIVVGGDDGPLGRADVGDDAVAGGGSERLADGVRQRSDGDRHEHGLGFATASDERRRRRDRARRAPAPFVTRRPERSKPATVAPSRSRAASAIEPPIRPTPTTAMFTRAVRARTEAARPSRTSTVVSQSMHASVIDWPYVSDSGASRSWRPARRKDSSITPTIARLPPSICAPTSAATAGWRSASLPLLSCETSITTRSGRPASRISASACATGSAP